ncbi:ankyrin [Mytilinidion resinicola]|uniref:Ankyrin n=1 Tax=Mytilinidion resinicola TaxID=574789 RepID=A0A6A6Y9H4_9PEZI|nr:ankyrin [Mytilinidion resinicola]KAF2804775.1 ankyrin [Mytilinidion resinicola]
MAEPDDNPDVGTSTPATNPLPGPDVHSSVPQPTEQPLPVEPTDVSEALYDAAEDGLLERVQALLLASPRADLESKHGGFQEETALCAAARNNHLDVVKCLVSAGALLDCTNYWHETPLHVSAHEGHFDIVQYLVQNIIDREDDVNLVDYVNLVDDGDETALHRAAEGSNVELVECLIEAGARIEVFNCDGRNPAMCASESDKSSAVLQLLLSRCPQIVNATQKNVVGYTCLHIAANSDAGNNVELLLGQGADPTIQDTDPLWEQTPWELACVRNRLDAMSAFAFVEMREKQAHPREHELDNIGNSPGAEYWKDLYDGPFPHYDPFPFLHIPSNTFLWALVRNCGLCFWQLA